VLALGSIWTLHNLRSTVTVAAETMPHDNAVGKGKPSEVQAGNMPKPGTAPVATGVPEHTLQPLSDEALLDAQHWVRTWPGARGATHLLPALLLSSHTWDHTDDLFVFSDGIVDDGAAALAYVRRKAAQGASRVPRIHCIGFFALGIHHGGTHKGAAFMKALAAASGGTFRTYERDTPQV
jgi:hypothetical protein